ncbi:MAG: site-specific integrase, partial [Clostridiales bacterium]|nr:site-specific integrase [Clostridiales bacterium]
MKIKNVSTDNNIFWKTAKDFLSHNLPNIRKVSEHTINAYRDGINKYIGYLENERLIKRENISFSDFRRDDLKDYLNWMLNIKKYAKKTCNLRITAIHSLLEYAAYEYSTDLKSVYLEVCTVKSVKADNGPIEYFESKQLRALLAAPVTSNRIGGSNQMIHVIYYDTDARISEIINATFE